MERIKLTNKRSENAEKELRISDVLRSFYDYHWKRTDVVEKFYDYHWKNPIKITYNGATVWVLPHLRAISLQITDVLTACIKTY